jgi:rSAM/selenodomain-associated transferase 1
MHALILFLKNPDAPHVKTRLSVGIGEAAARHTYRLMLQHTLAVAGELPCRVLLFVDGDVSHPLWNDTSFTVMRQHGSDLGERLSNACEIAFSEGHDRVVVTGGDIPDISTSILTDAFDALDTHDFVVGPAHDGGYYLIGMREMSRAVFRQIPWSSPDVLRSTLSAIEQLDKRVVLLETLADVDVVQDLGLVRNTGLVSAVEGIIARVP